MEACLVAGVKFVQDSDGYWALYDPRETIDHKNVLCAQEILRDVVDSLAFANTEDYLKISGLRPSEIRRRLDALEIPNE